ncbi:EthD family reductase [Curtobacterium sp. MCPF17_002]|uniref:EthD family reductase n=1 Tax=Curtobacterium sp. MCPF17_002 TaxID=2175645 RepID=UPI000DA9AF91|nr:EthD family reductase [Curtobacterium sp. MCPF17_002]WIB76765.1 EthD family reductase [Curtobacterium sp. MCPF17_002]
MPTKITLIVDNPVDPTAFETAYPRIDDLARQLPGLRRAESAKVWPKEDGSPTPAHRTLDLYFDSYEDASAAVATPAAQDFFGALLGTGVTFTGLFSDIETA